MQVYNDTCVMPPREAWPQGAYVFPHLPEMQAYLCGASDGGRRRGGREGGRSIEAYEWAWDSGEEESRRISGRRKEGEGK